MTFNDLHEFARGFSGFAGGYVEDLAKEAHTAIHERVVAAAQALAPKGATGQLAASIVSDPSNPQSAIDQLRPTAVVSTDDYGKAATLDVGRFQSKRSFQVRGKRGTFTVPAGKWMGSKQAPRGISRPARAQVRRVEDAILEAAIARVEARYR